MSLTPCFPSREQNHVYLGDKNSLNLTFHAQNVGEGGAYEAELRVTAPPEAEYSGLVRNPGVRGSSQTRLGRGPTRGAPKPHPYPPHLQNFSSLSCDYSAVNQSRLLVCDLGNPMKAGASVSLAQERIREGGDSLSRAQRWNREGGWNWSAANAQSNRLLCPPTLPHRSGVAFGSQSLTSGTQRKPSSLTSRFSGREGMGLGGVEPGAGGHCPWLGSSTTSVSPPSSARISTTHKAKWFPSGSQWRLTPRSPLMGKCPGTLGPF